MFFALALTVTLANPAFAADASKPHPHQGSIPKFTSAPTPLPLSAADTAALVAGKPVYKQQRYASGDGGRGVAIFDVHATEATVWGTILDFGAYPKMVDKVEQCGTYERVGNEIYVRFKLSVLGVEYFIHHSYRPEAGYLTWQLDYRRTSDLDDSVGYWLVHPATGHDGYTRVEYTVDLRASGWVPDFVQKMLMERGVEDATTWLKKSSEARQAAQGG